MGSAKDESEERKPLVDNEQGDSLWSLCDLREQRPLLATGIVALTVSSAVNFRTGPLFRGLIDNPNATGKTLVGTGVLFTVGAIASYIRTYCFGRAETALRTSLSLRAFSSLLRIRRGTESSNVGSQLALVRDDTTKVAEFWTVKVQNCLRYFCSILGGTVMCIYVSPELAGCTLPLVFYGSYKGMRRRAQHQSASQSKLLDARDVAMDFCEQRLSQAPVIRAFNAVERESSSFLECLSDYNRLSLRAARRSGLMMGTIDICMKGTFMALVYGGGQLVKRNKLTGGQLTQFILHAAMVGMGFAGVIGVSADAAEARISADRLVEQEALAKAEKAKEEIYTNKSSDPAEITFKDVSFRYPSEETSALNGVSFTVKAGQVLGLAGESGSGKSTILGLLSGELEPTSGQILVNGVPIKSGENPSDFLILSYVSQQPKLFGRSIQDAISLRGATDGDVGKALQQAEATGFIRQDVAEPLEGSSFSGGEIARLCLARAFYGSSAVLLLDEPCAGLDGPTTESIVKSIHAQKTTCIFATHRLEMLRDSDEVVVIADGTVRQQGTYKNLKTSGEFSRLFSRKEEASSK